jgi:hypothetical protein
MINLEKLPNLDSIRCLFSLLSCRFYGRIAVDGNEHEPETLQAIRENAEGLKGTITHFILSRLHCTILNKFVVIIGTGTLSGGTLGGGTLSGEIPNSFYVTCS